MALARRVNLPKMVSGDSDNPSDEDLLRLHFASLGSAPRSRREAAEVALTEIAQFRVDGDILALSPTGSAVVHKTQDGLHYRDLGQEAGHLVSPYRWELQAEFSPGGSRFVFYSWQWCALYTPGLDALAEFHQVQDPDEGLVGSVQFLGEDQIVLGDSQARVFHLRQGEARPLYHLPISRDLVASEWSALQQTVGVSALGLMAASEGSRLQVWSVHKAPTLGESLWLRRGRFSLLAWSVPGDFLVLLEQQPERIVAFDGATGQVVWERDGGCGLLIFHPRQCQILVLRETLEVWHARTGETLAVLGDFSRETLRGAGFLADGRLYTHARVGAQSDLKVWSCEVTAEPWETGSAEFQFPLPGPHRVATSPSLRPLSEMGEEPGILVSRDD